MSEPSTLDIAEKPKRMHSTSKLVTICMLVSALSASPALVAYINKPDPPPVQSQAPIALDALTIKIDRIEGKVDRIEGKVEANGKRAEGDWREINARLTALEKRRRY